MLPNKPPLRKPLPMQKPLPMLKPLLTILKDLEMEVVFKE
jgi:hypothetical protein